MKQLLKAIKKSESELKNINSSLKSIKKTMEKPPKIDVDTPLEIKLVEQTKEDKRKLFWKRIISISVLTLFTYVIIIIISQKTDNIPQKPFPIKGFKGFIKYPPLIFVEEEEIIELTLINSSKKSIGEVKSFLIYPQESFVKIASNDGSSIVQFDSLDTEESKTKTIKFQINKANTLKMELTLKITAKAVTDIIEETYPIIVIPIPRFKSFILLLIIYLVNVIIIPVISGKMKKIL